MGSKTVYLASGWTTDTYTVIRYVEPHTKSALNAQRPYLRVQAKRGMTV
jgi:hypothetical protein